MLKTAQTRLLPQYIGIGEPSLIRPLCAPIMPDDSFGTDVAGRYSERVYSLWKRLSLVYAEEGVQAAAPEKPPVIVNSFTSRVLVQLFAGNQFNRLVKYDQPNSVFSTKFSAAAKTEKKRAAAELVRYISERTELTAALEDFGRTLSGTASERGAFVALAALSRISAGKLTDGGRRAVEALSAAISETDGAAAQTAAELSRAADERTAQELGEKLTELTRRYSAAAEKNRALSAAVEYAKELIESGSAEKAAPEAISRAALERFDKRCGVQGAAAERLRALSERTEQGGLPAGEGAARVISAQRQARAGLMGAEAETAALAAGVLAGRAAAYPAYSAGALLPVTANIGSADVPTARTRAGEPLVYAQDSVQAEGAQAFGADIAASVARRVVKAAGLMSAGSPNSAVGGSAAGSGAASAVGAANAGVGGSAAAVGAMAAQRAVGAESILSRASRNIADKSAPERRAVRGAGSESAANAAQYAGLAGSGAGGFYRVLSEYAQTAQLRKIAQSSSFLFGEAFARNGENGSDGATGADGTNAARGIDGTNGANATPATPAKGTVLPVEAAHGALSRAGEVVFAQNGENGANGSDGATGADGTNGVRGIDGTNGTNAAPAKGTVLPVEATRGALSRAGEVVFAQNGENGANGSDGATGADGANAAPATLAKGTVLPVEATRGTLSRAGEVVFAQNGENGANGSDGATGADGANGVRGNDGLNGTNATPAKGTVLPVEATRGTLSRPSEVVFAQNGENGANGSDGVTGADGANGARGIDGTNGANGMNATPAKGTVLPVEATHGALSRAGEVVFAQNGENGANGSDGATGAYGSNGARGNDGTNGTNAAPATPAKGTVLPVEATRGMLSRTSEVVFAQNGENGANGSDGVTGADGANGARGNDGLNGTNDAPATPAKGTVLPVEAAHGALSRAGEVVFAQNGENGSDGTNGARGIDGTNGAASANSSTARKAGRILPAGGTVRAAAGPHKPQSTADSGISRAVMDRLDPQTASALAGLVREAKGAGQGAVYTARIVPAQTEHGAQELSYAQTEGGISQAADSGGGISANAMRIMLMNLRTAALSRKHTELRTQNVSRHNQNVILSANAPARKYDAPYLAMRSAVTFRTTESADIVMLAPPVEMDRFSAESGYSRQMPPIEFKQREEAPAPPAPPPAAKPKAVSKTTEQIVRTQLPKGLDGLSYAEISRLADKVYAQIEARLNRERIRRGL